MLAGLLVIATLTGIASAGTVLIVGQPIAGAVLAYVLGGTAGLLLGAALLGLSTSRTARVSAVSSQPAHPART